MNGETPNPWPAQRAKLIQLVTEMVKALVDDSKGVEVTATAAGRSTVIKVLVSPHEYSKVIGKGGRYIKAIAAIAVAAGGKFRQRIVLTLVESDGRSRRPQLQRPADEDFSAAWRDHK